MNIKELEALVVGRDELLVIRVVDQDVEERQMKRLQEFLEDGPLRGRYILLAGEVEFAKVKQ